MSQAILEMGSASEDILGRRRQGYLPAYVGLIGESPLGAIWVAVSDGGLAAVEIGADLRTIMMSLERRGYRPVLAGNPLLVAAMQQISEYLSGSRRDFDLPIDWSGMTAFQEHVLHLTCGIPYGETRTYGEIAAGLGRPRAARAVGRAEATNPMPLVIPCHRVIGADGGLHGYGGAGGIATKAWLLKLEGGR